MRECSGERIMRESSESECREKAVIHNNRIEKKRG